MIVRTTPVTFVAWGNGTSARYITAQDNLGFGLNDTVVYAGTTSRLRYLNHIESVYCISGTGWIEEKDGAVHELSPGVLYVLDQHDAHSLGAFEDLRVICVFTPGLFGTETHRLTDDGYSGF